MMNFYSTVGRIDEENRSIFKGAWSETGDENGNIIE